MVDADLHRSVRHSSGVATMPHEVGRVARGAVFTPWEQRFLGVAPTDSLTGNLVGNARLLGERIPAGVLPIADDPFGNLVCIDAREGRDGPVLFWDHEYEGDPPDEANLYEVAPDLQSFLDGLTERPPSPDPAPRSGLRRRFGRR